MVAVPGAMQGVGLGDVQGDQNRNQAAEPSGSRVQASPGLLLQQGLLCMRVLQVVAPGWSRVCQPADGSNLDSSASWRLMKSGQSLKKRKEQDKSPGRALHIKSLDLIRVGQGSVVARRCVHLLQALGSL